MQESAIAMARWLPLISIPVNVWIGAGFVKETLESGLPVASCCKLVVWLVILILWYCIGSGFIPC